MLAVIAVGVVLSSLEPGRADVPAGDFDLVADAIERARRPATRGPTHRRRRSRGGRSLSVIARRLRGRARRHRPGGPLVPVAWVALPARLVGLVVVVLPLLLQRRLRLTRAALPLVVIAGVGEILGSMLSAWGARESIAIAAVLGSQFAAIAAVVAFSCSASGSVASRSSVSSSSSSASRSSPPCRVTARLTRLHSAP